MSTVRTSLIIFERSLRYTRRNPGFVIIGLVQPLLYLVLFGPLLSRLSQGPGFNGQNTWRIFVPGLLVQQCLFAAVFVGFGLIAEVRGGVLDRMRVSAASPAGLLLGRVARDVVVLVAQAIVLTLGALVAGLRAPLGGVLAGFGLVALVGIGLSTLAYGVALRIPSEEAFGQMLNGLMLPLTLLSGVLLPLSLAPAWLAGLAKANPISHVVVGVRAMFAGNVTSSASLTGVAVAVGLAAAGIWFATRAIRGTR